VRRLSLGLAALALAAALPLGHAVGPASSRGELVLLAFLDLGEVAGPGRGSRSQAVFLRSMAAQHPQLRLLLVDVSGQEAGLRRSRAADWHLDALPVLPLSSLEERARSSFSGVAPETMLLRAGTLLRRWRGFASAAELDRALREAAAPPRAPGGG
jgi:hypothetical protein